MTSDHIPERMLLVRIRIRMLMMVVVDGDLCNPYNRGNSRQARQAPSYIYINPNMTTCVLPLASLTAKAVSFEDQSFSELAEKGKTEQKSGNSGNLPRVVKVATSHGTPPITSTCKRIIPPGKKKVHPCPLQTF